MDLKYLSLIYYLQNGIVIKLYTLLYMIITLRIYYANNTYFEM